MKPADFTRTLVAIVLALGAACNREAPVLRYAYVVTCDGRVDKLDTSVDKKIASYDLAASNMKELLPSGNQAIDGCLAYHPAFDAGGGLLYFVSPTGPNANPDGTRDYRILGFSVPELKLVKTLPGASNQSEAPGLEILSGAPHAVSASDARAVTDLSLGDFAPNHEASPNQIVERSGNRVLLRIFGADAAELRLAVADTEAKTIVWLKSQPPTTALQAHLSPGGAMVLIEVSDTGKTNAKSGKLASFDAVSGALLQEVTGDGLRGQNFLAITPTGKAVYSSGESYSFVDLKRTFGGQAVAHPLDANRPAVFFAPR